MSLAFFFPLPRTIHTSRCINPSLGKKHDVEGWIKQRRVPLEYGLQNPSRSGPPFLSRFIVPDAGIHFTLKISRVGHTRGEKEAKCSGIGNNVVPALDRAECYKCSKRTFATKKDQRKRASFKGLTFICDKILWLFVGVPSGAIVCFTNEIKGRG